MYVALSLCRSDVLFRTVQCSAEHGLLMNELIVPSLPGMTKVAVGQLAPSPSTCTLWTIVQAILWDAGHVVSGTSNPSNRPWSKLTCYLLRNPCNIPQAGIYGGSQ